MGFALGFNDEFDTRTLTVQKSIYWTNEIYENVMIGCEVFILSGVREIGHNHFNLFSLGTV